MSLEITGKLIKKLAVVSGTNSRGIWSKQEFVIETQESYPKKVCMNVWGIDKVKEFEGFNEGDVLKISFNLESREFNERWYSDIRAWRIERVTAGTSAQTAADSGPFEISDDGEDDLPF